MSCPSTHPMILTLDHLFPTLPTRTQHQGQGAPVVHQSPDTLQLLRELVHTLPHCPHTLSTLPSGTQHQRQKAPVLCRGAGYLSCPRLHASHNLPTISPHPVHSSLRSATPVTRSACFSSRCWRPSPTSRVPRCRPSSTASSWAVRCVPWQGNNRLYDMHRHRPQVCLP